MGVASVRSRVPRTALPASGVPVAVAVAGVVGAEPPPFAGRVDAGPPLSEAKKGRAPNLLFLIGHRHCWCSYRFLHCLQTPFVACTMASEAVEAPAARAALRAGL